jgi:predicted membrane GTPase involved in stress response
MKKKGTSMVVIEAAGAGDIISMAGLSGPAIGHTVANPEVVIILCLLLVAEAEHIFVSIVSNFLVFTCDCYL